MNGVVETLVINAASASLLAGLVWIAGRFVRHPGVMHALWVVVLIKLVTPPVFEIAALPRLAGSEATEVTVSATALPPEMLARLAATPPRVTPVRDLAFSAWDAVAGPLGLWIWGAGIAGLLLLGLVRALRFRRLVARAPLAPRPIRERTSELARQIGVARCPAVRLVEGRVPPMLWSCLGSCEILFPRALLERLEVGEHDALITHELAHLRRRDHWVRYLELATLVLFWWHPLVWWIRRNLRIAEEKSCDALVLRTLPRRSGHYARGLLKTLEFLAGRSTPVPQLGTGAAETRHLKERLTMIVQDRAPRRLRPAHRWILALLALSALVVFPTWLDPVAAGSRDDDREELLEIRRNVVELEAQLRDLRAREAELRHTMDAGRFEEEMALRQAHADQLAARGELEAADKLRRELEETERHYELDRERARAELQLMKGSGAIEFELHRAMIEAEEAEARGDETQAEEAHVRARELELELQKLHQQAQAEHLRTQNEELDRAAAELHQAIDEARERGDDRTADMIRRKLQHMMQREDRSQKERYHAEMAGMKRERDRLAKMIAESRSRGELEEAERLEQSLIELETELEMELKQRELEYLEQRLEQQRQIEDQIRSELEERRSSEAR